MTQFRPSRRLSLGLMAGAAGLAAGGSAAAAPRFDLADPKTRMEAYVRMRARLDGVQTFMPYKGTIFGKMEGRAAVPVFDVEGFSWARATRQPDGNYRMDGVEAGYFLDRETHQPLDTWVNPLNGLTCKAKHYRSYSHAIVTPAGLQPIREGPLAAGIEMSANTGEPTVMNGTVWMHEDLIGTFPNRPKADFADPLEYFGPTLTATSLATWSASLADLANPKMAFVPTLLSYQTMGSWRPFMRMGSAPGLISWRMFGQKAETIDGVPKALRDRVMAQYPDFLTREKAEAPKIIGT